MPDPFQTRYPISVDSTWALPNPLGKPPPEDRARARYFQQVINRDIPINWTDNRALLSNQYVGTQYVGIQRTGTWLGGSTVVVECLKDELPLSKSYHVRKANHSGGLGNDERYHPVEPGHPLAELFEEINEVDTFQDFIWKLVIQDMLTGYGHIWMPPNMEGRPAGEMWVLPSVLLQPQFGYVNEHYPFGGYRLNPQYGMGWGGVGIPAIANVLIPRQEVVVLRSPHPFIMAAGYGATQALRQQIDILNAVETARVSSMGKGIRKDILVTLEGASDQQVKDLAADLNKKWGGAENNGGVGVVGADAANVNVVNQSPRDMDFPAGWEQSVRAVLGGYGVPPVVAGMIEANYAEFWGALRAWEATTIGPWATRFGARFTKDVARKHYGKEYRIRLIPPKINDPDLKIQQLSYTPNDVWTVNENRAAWDLSPFDDGDVVPSVYAAQQQQAMGVGPDGQPVGEDGDFSGHPLNAMGDSILEALGVAGGDGATDPSNDPFGPDPDQPDDADDSDPDTDVFPGKAFGRFEESKHKRGQPGNRGQFGSGGGNPGAGKQPGNTVPGGKPAIPGQPAAGRNAGATPLSPQAASHPAVVNARKRITAKIGEIAQRVNAAMLTAGMGPDELLGDQSSWERWFCTQHADAVAASTGLDVQTAAAVLSRLVAHAVSAIKPHLRGGADRAQPAPQTTPAGPAAPTRLPVARPSQTGEDGGKPPVNRLAAGSLPPKGKAFAAEFLATLT